MLIEMKVKNLAFDLAKSGAMVFLEEMNGKRVLPIWIGIFEANAIALELRKINTARPMYAADFYRARRSGKNDP